MNQWQDRFSDNLKQLKKSHQLIFKNKKLSDNLHFSVSNKDVWEATDILLETPSSTGQYTIINWSVVTCSHNKRLCHTGPPVFGHGFMLQ